MRANMSSKQGAFGRDIEKTYLKNTVPSEDKTWNYKTAVLKQGFKKTLFVRCKIKVHNFFKQNCCLVLLVRYIIMIMLYHT